MYLIHVISLLLPSNDGRFSKGLWKCLIHYKIYLWTISFDEWLEVIWLGCISLVRNLFLHWLVHISDLNNYVWSPWYKVMWGNWTVLWSMQGLFFLCDSFRKTLQTALLLYSTEFKLLYKLCKKKNYLYITERCMQNRKFKWAQWNRGNRTGNVYEKGNKGKEREREPLKWPFINFVPCSWLFTHCRVNSNLLTQCYFFSSGGGG